MTVANTVVLLKEAMTAAQAGDSALTRQLFRQVVELDAQHETGWLGLASVAESPLEAVHCLQQVLDLNPENYQARATLPDTLLQAGIAEAQAGDLASAAILFEQVNVEDPCNEQAWLWRASIADNPQSAMQALEKALEINPQNENALEELKTLFFQTGVAEANKGNLAAARGWLQRLTDLDPTNEQGWLWLAQVAEAPDYAMLCWRRVLEINPDNAQAQTGLLVCETPTGPSATLWTCPLCGTEGPHTPRHCPTCRSLQSLADPAALLAPADVDRNQVRAAIAHYQQIVAGQPEALVHSYLALAHANMGDFPQAARELEEAVRLDPNNSALRAHLAVLGTLSQTAAAERDRRKSVLIADSSPTVRQVLTVILKRLGYRVVTSCTGAETVDLVRSLAGPSLVFLDSALPGMTTSEVCASIRRAVGAGNVQVVILSARESSFDRMRSRMAGAAEYLTKPFRPEALTELATRLLPTNQNKGTAAPETRPNEDQDWGNELLAMVCALDVLREKLAVLEQPRRPVDVLLLLGLMTDKATTIARAGRSRALDAAGWTEQLLRAERIRREAEDIRRQLGGSTMQSPWKLEPNAQPDESGKRLQHAVRVGQEIPALLDTLFQLFRQGFENEKTVREWDQTAEVLLTELRRTVEALAPELTTGA